MGGKGKEAAQRLLAIIVIVAMMSAMGIPPPVIIFFAIVIYFVWRAVQHTERQETNRIFDFYISANDILRDDERRWFGFEIAAVTNEGERILREMADAPPLLYYALGALYHCAGDHTNAREHFAQLLETEVGDESRRLTGSPELRRYVETLRRLERDPSEKPQVMAAVKSLERARRSYARPLLDQTRAQLASAEVNPANAPASRQPPRRADDAHTSFANHVTHAPLNDAINPVGAADARHEGIAASTHNLWVSAPRADINHPRDEAFVEQQQTSNHAAGEPRSSITEVLRDVYEEEKKTA